MTGSFHGAPLQRTYIALGILIGAGLCLALADRQADRMESAAFGRGAVAGMCLAVSIQWPDPAARPADIAASLRACEPRLRELAQRTDGRS